MSSWPPNDKHRFARPRRALAAGFLLFCGGCVAVNWVGDRMPSTTSVGPTPCDVTIAGQCARHLTTTTTSTRPSPTTLGPMYGPERPTPATAGEDGGLWVIDGDHAYPLPRTPEVVQALWLATHYYAPK